MFENTENTLFESESQKNLSEVVDKLIFSYSSLKEENEKLKNDLDSIKNEAQNVSFKTKDELDKLETIVLEQTLHRDS